MRACHHSVVVAVVSSDDPGEAHEVVGVGARTGAWATFAPIEDDDRLPDYEDDGRSSPRGTGSLPG